MAHDRKTLLPMLSGFAEHTVLALVYHKFRGVSTLEPT
mgnify:CR=1 FL=1